MILEEAALPSGDSVNTVSHTPDSILVRQMLPIENWSVVFNFPVALVKQARLPVVQSSITFAILFALMILSLLFYFLWRDKQYEHSLLKLAYVDDLTKLPNKNSFMEDAFTLVQRTNTSYAVMVLDITKFKLINDHFGYAFGDTLLVHFASILPRYTTIDGLCARLDGDRFILMIAYREKRALEERIKLLTKELATFSFPASSRFRLRLAIGISILDGKEISIPTAIDRALIALSALKTEQSSGFQYYEEAIRDQLVEENELDQVFKSALKNHEFFVVLQPKYALDTETLAGAEALVRWNHPTKGLLSPQKFIPLLEKYNLLTQLDMFVLEQVCRMFRSWKDRSLPLMTISVNQSRSHLFNSHYEETLLSLVDKYAIPHHLLEFELTESLFLEDIERLSEVLGTLRNEGFVVSLDDFGTGYSSLNMLKNVQIDKIKLDQGFFGDAADDKRSENLVRSIINMAKDLGISTVAEGVERREQVDMLKVLGCDIAQGYYYSGPISLEDFEQLLVALDVGAFPKVGLD